MSEPLTREDYLVTLNLFARSTQEERDHGPLRADLIAHVDALREQLATARQAVWEEIADGMDMILSEHQMELSTHAVLDWCREQARKEQP